MLDNPLGTSWLSWIVIRNQSSNIDTLTNSRCTLYFNSTISIHLSDIIRSMICGIQLDWTISC